MNVANPQALTRSTFISPRGYNLGILARKAGMAFQI